MATLTPVDDDPFAAAAPPAAASPPVVSTVTVTPRASAAPKLTPVDHDPFAIPGPPAAPKPTTGQSGDYLDQPHQKAGDFYGSAYGPPAQYEPMLQAAASKHGVPLSVLHWVGYHESGWQPDAVNQQETTDKPKGMFQFKDATAKELGINPLDPAQAIDGAARYLKKLADRNGGDWIAAVEQYGTFSTGQGAQRDAAAKAGFGRFLTGTGAAASTSGRNTTARQGPTPEDATDAAEDDPDFPEDNPNRYYANFLPFSEDTKTHEKTWGVGQNELVRTLSRGLRDFGERLSGPLTPEKMHGLSGDEEATFLTIGGMPSPTTKMFAPTGQAAVRAGERALAQSTARTNREAALAAAAANSPRSIEGKASTILEKRLNQDVRSNSVYRPEVDYDVPARIGHNGQPVDALPPADQVLETLDRMRFAGKPANIIHAAGRNVAGEAGKMFRAPGESAGVMQTGLQRIDAGASQRHIDAVGKWLTKGSSAYRTTLDLLQKRSTEGKPLYEKALAGGSMAPLEAMMTAEWNAASQASREADQAVAVAQSQLNAALAKQSRAGENVYLSAGANQQVRDAQQAVRQAQIAQSDAAATADLVKQWMQRTQQDRIDNVPGAVWNPRIQRLLDRPKVKQGLRLGMEIQADEAAAEGAVFNPHEFASDEQGNLIRVPNMRTLNVAKKGLDRMYSDTLDEFGRPTEAGVAIDMMRRALLKEMDAINPDYAKARQAWAGDSQNLDAVKWAKGINKISPEQVAQEFSDMSESEKEFARLGIADTLLEQVGNTAFGADESKNMLKNPNMRDRLQPIFPTQDDFRRFVQHVADERRMYDVQSRIAKGSPTAERKGEDVQQILSAGEHFSRAGDQFLHGRLFRALGSGLSGAQSWLRRPNAEVNEALAKQMMDEQLQLGHGPKGTLQVRRPAAPLNIIGPPGQ